MPASSSVSSPLNSHASGASSSSDSLASQQRTHKWLTRGAYGLGILGTACLIPMAPLALAGAIKIQTLVYPLFACALATLLYFCAKRYAGSVAAPEGASSPEPFIPVGQVPPPPVAPGAPLLPPSAPPSDELPPPPPYESSSDSSISGPAPVLSPEEQEREKVRNMNMGDFLTYAAQKYAKEKGLPEMKPLEAIAKGALSSVLGSLTKEERRAKWCAWWQGMPQERDHWRSVTNSGCDHQAHQNKFAAELFHTKFITEEEFLAWTSIQPGTSGLTALKKWEEFRRVSGFAPDPCKEEDFRNEIEPKTAKDFLDPHNEGGDWALCRRALWWDPRLTSAQYVQLDKLRQRLLGLKKPQKGMEAIDPRGFQKYTLDLDRINQDFESVFKKTGPALALSGAPMASAPSLYGSVAIAGWGKK